jgi:hypothetical protein
VCRVQAGRDGLWRRGGASPSGGVAKQLGRAAGRPAASQGFAPLWPTPAPGPIGRVTITSFTSHFALRGESTSGPRRGMGEPPRAGAADWERDTAPSLGCDRGSRGIFRCVPAQGPAMGRPLGGAVPGGVLGTCQPWSVPCPSPETVLSPGNRRLLHLAARTLWRSRWILSLQHKTHSGGGSAA